MEKQDDMKISDALILTGFGKFNIFVVIACGGCLVSVITEGMEGMFIVPAAECDLELDIAMKGYISGMTFLGLALASHFWGFLADLYGRQITILISLTLASIASTMTSIAINSWMYLVLRFLTGLFLGGASSVVSTYLGELHSDYYRPIVFSWTVIFVAIANITLSGLAWLVLPLQFTYKIPLLNVVFNSWRLLEIVYSFPTVLLAICFFLLPETPKFLLSKNKAEEALLILQKIYISNTGKQSTEFNTKVLILDEVYEDQFRGNGFLNMLWLQTGQLYRTPYLLKSILIDFLQFGVFMTSTGFYMWYPEIINKISIFEAENPNNESTICGSIAYRSENEYNLINNTWNSCNNTIQTDVFKVNLFLGGFLIILYTINAIIVGCIGRKTCLILLLLLSASTAIPLQYLSGSSTVRLLMSLALASYTGIGLINSITVDIYPTQLRGMGVAMSLMFGRIGAAVGSHLAGKLFYYMCDISFVLYGVFHIVLILIVHLLTVTMKPSKPNNTF